MPRLLRKYDYCLGYFLEELIEISVSEAITQFGIFLYQEIEVLIQNTCN